jgi:nucleoside diphosphate kinase
MSPSTEALPCPYAARLAASSRTLCIVKPNAFDRRDAVIHDIVVDQGVHILIHDELMLTEEQVDELYAEHLQVRSTCRRLHCQSYCVVRLFLIVLMMM